MTGPGPMGVHTAGNAVPPLTDNLAGAFEDTDGAHPATDQIIDGFRLANTERLTVDQTMTILATLTGEDGADLVTVFALTLQRLTDPDTNPCLRGLPLERQKEIRSLGERYTQTIQDTPRHLATRAIALIHGN
ncbi:hypothetical protein ACFQ6Q_00540 [Streptomyces sp. NPDC056437]|uniref:hypothetical protein n=1 Tax=Streptomyces sp. NPDC056437 TaxID=3345816 RepID=UPI0036CFCE93